MYTQTPHLDFQSFKDDTRVSPSSLNQFLECPYYYWAKRVAKFWTDKDNENFIIGGAADALITEGREVFESKYHVSKLRTKKAKEQAAQDEIELISEKQALLINGMEKELQRQPLYKNFTLPGWQAQAWIEIDIVDDFDQSSIKAVGKLDYFHNEGVIADLKTCASLDTFRPSYYDLQMGMYHELVKIDKGLNCEVYIIAVDKTEMTRMRIFKVSEATLDHGKTLMRRAIEQLKACRENNGWASIQLDDSKPHACPTYDTCPYGIQNKIFII